MVRHFRKPSNILTSVSDVSVLLIFTARWRSLSSCFTAYPLTTQSKIPLSHRVLLRSLHRGSRKFASVRWIFRSLTCDLRPLFLLPPSSSYLPPLILRVSSCTTTTLRDLRSHAPRSCTPRDLTQDVVQDRHPRSRHHHHGVQRTPLQDALRPTHPILPWLCSSAESSRTQLVTRGPPCRYPLPARSAGL
jgi:hypothetical protein